MSYRIQYSGKTGKYEVTSKEGKPSPMLWMMFLGCVLLLLFALQPDIWIPIRSILIPGEDAVTVQAFQTMYGDLRSGAPIHQAFYDFCLLVIYGV